MVEGGGDISQCGQNKIVGRGERHGYFCRKPGDGVRNTFGSGFEHPNGVAAIRVEGRTYVPSVIGMWRPRRSVVGLFVDEDTNARWCNGGAVEVKGAVELGPR
jgi:hypothetical protein